MTCECTCANASSCRFASEIGASSFSISRARFSCLPERSTRPSGPSAANAAKSGFATPQSRRRRASASCEGRKCGGNPTVRSATRRLPVCRGKTKSGVPGAPPPSLSSTCSPCASASARRSWQCRYSSNFCPYAGILKSGTLSPSRGIQEARPGSASCSALCARNVKNFQPGQITARTLPCDYPPTCGNYSIAFSRERHALDARN